MKDQNVKTTFLDNIFKNKYAVILVITVIVLAFMVFMIYKKTQKMQKNIKEYKKSENEITNLKYGLQDTVNVVKDLRQKLYESENLEKLKKKSQPKKIIPEMVKVPEPIPEINVKKEKIDIDSVFSDDVEGEYEEESDSKVIELEEDSDDEDEN